jgi:pyruvate formate lyase activating enzyme
MVEGKLALDRGLCNASGRCVACCPERALEIVGLEMAPEEVVAEVLSDKVFYDVSGGGVTFSGGEPLLQSEFVRDVASKLKEQGIHVTVDTAGNVPWHCFEEVLPYTDLFLYDIKFCDASDHQRCTGFDNELILKNARKLAQHGTPIIVRLVIIPGSNDPPQEFQARLDFVRSLEVVTQIDLLPYHRLGVAKYERLGKAYGPGDLGVPDKEHLETLRRLATGQGFLVTVGG